VKKIMKQDPGLRWQAHGGRKKRLLHSSLWGMTLVAKKGYQGKSRKIRSKEGGFIEVDAFPPKEKIIREKEARGGKL